MSYQQITFASKQKASLSGDKHHQNCQNKKQCFGA